jgi:hypothetical protein
MAISLVIYELADKGAVVSKDHFALAYPFVIEKFTLVYVSIAEVVYTSTITLSTLEISLEIVAVCKLFKDYLAMILPKS